MAGYRLDFSPPGPETKTFILQAFFFIIIDQTSLVNIYVYRKRRQCQGLRASSLQFTSPLEFNAIYRDGFTLQLELNGWSKICDPVTAKFKHVTVIVTCTLLCCDDVT